MHHQQKKKTIQVTRKGGVPFGPGVEKTMQANKMQMVGTVAHDVLDVFTIHCVFYCQ